MKQAELFDLTYAMGEEMLKNGGEVDRTEDMIARLAESFQLEDFDAFVLVNGIFMTARVNNQIYQAKVKDIPVSPISLNRLDALNTLSRKIVAQEITPEAATEELKKIHLLQEQNVIEKFLAFGFGSGAFGYIFGGSFLDAVASFFVGLILALFMIFLVPHFQIKKIFIHTIGAMLVTLCALVLKKIFPVLNLNQVIIGGVISLLPGVPFVNAVRYLFSDDYDSGMVRLLDAGFISLCIAIGVGVVLSLASFLKGGL